MNFSHMALTLLLLASVCTLHKPILANPKGLNLLVISPRKFSFFLWLRNLKHDIFNYIVCALLITVSHNNVLETLATLLFYITVVIFYRICEYQGKISLLLLFSTPYLISITLGSQVLNLFTSFLFLLSMTFNASISQNQISGKHRKKRLWFRDHQILFITTSFVLVDIFTPINTYFKFSQILPIVFLVIATLIESSIISQKTTLRRYQSYFDIYRLKTNKITPNILGFKMRQNLLDIASSLSLALAYYALRTQSFMQALSLLFVILLSLLGSLDLLTQHYLTNKSIIYDNFLTRFIVSQVPSWIAFTYVIYVSLEDNVISHFPMLNESFYPLYISISLALTTVYIARLNRLIKRK